MDEYIKFFILPDDGRKSILELINCAKSSICIMIYAMYDDQIQQAIVDAVNRCVKVRIIYDPPTKSSQSHSHNFIVQQEEIFFAKFPKIQAVLSSDVFPIMHQKSIIVDGSIAAIMTLNMVGKGGYNTFEVAREFGIITNRSADVNTLINQFELDWKNATTGSRDIFPKTEPCTSVFFSPSTVDDPRNSFNVISGLIKSAKHTLDIYTEVLTTFDDDKDIIGILGDAVKRGVAVRIIVQQFLKKYDLPPGVIIAQVPSKFYLYFHAKGIIMDKSLAAIMSVNILHPSIFQYREAGIVVEKQDIVSQMSECFEKDWNAIKNNSAFKHDGEFGAIWSI